MIVIFLIGLSDLTVPGDWGWVDCSSTTPYQDSLWAPGYPLDNTLGTCAALQPGGDVIDLPCDLRFSYLCEISPKGEKRLPNEKQVHVHYTWRNF